MFACGLAQLWLSGMGPGLARVEAERGVKDEGRRGSMLVVRQGRVSSCRAASRPWGMRDGYLRDLVAVYSVVFMRLSLDLGDWTGRVRGCGT